jgi:signal transduction histidine kinase
MVRSAESRVRPTVDHDRIAQNLNDVVTHRLFAAGFDLHVALGLIGDHRAIGTIHHAIGGLDQAIRELRNTAYGLGPATGPPAHDTGPQ